MINIPQTSAENVEIFGDDFEEDNSGVVPFQDENEDVGSTLIFNDPTKNEQEPSVVVKNPPIKKAPKIKKSPKVNDKSKADKSDDEENIDASRKSQNTRDNKSNKILRTRSQRFIKVAMDDTYIYYLDKQSIMWKRLPYFANEYMVDCWVRMIERNPDNSNLPNDVSDYINGGVNGEIEVAAERGLSFNQNDIDVLKHKKFFLEHYYIRPKTKQIQFLCELEVIGHPQNTISEREYAYKNWEDLVPGSIESMIYNVTIKEVHRSKADAKGHMSVADMVDEYLRISIR